MWLDLQIPISVDIVQRVTKAGTEKRFRITAYVKLVESSIPGWSLGTWHSQSGILVNEELSFMADAWSAFSLSRGIVSITLGLHCNGTASPAVPCWLVNFLESERFWKSAEPVLVDRHSDCHRLLCSRQGRAAMRS